MATILIAEDSQTQALEIQLMLEKAGHQVRLAVDGSAALVAMSEEVPEILLTDMHMPKLNGLQLTEQVRESFVGVVVVLMTADGSEDLAVDALRLGAANYIPKRLLERDLISIIDGIGTMLQSRKSRTSILSALTHSEATYTFGNHREFATSLVSQFESDLRNLNYDDETGMFRITTALGEAILNAIEHGNLELDSDLRDNGDGEEYHNLGRDRLTQEPYCYRKVTVSSRISPEQLAYVIRDEGPGFDPSTLPNPEDPENMLRGHGRGLLLIRSFMDEVVFNETGNQITLIKYRETVELDEPSILVGKRNLRILLVEDSVTSRVLAKSILERDGHTVSIACDGTEAVQKSADETFDLILMDIEMPKLDGLSATRQIRSQQNPSETETPIVAMTSHDSEDDIQSCYDSGMQGHIPKPVQVEVLNAVLVSL